MVNENSEYIDVAAWLNRVRENIVGSEALINELRQQMEDTQKHLNGEMSRLEELRGEEKLVSEAASKYKARVHTNGTKAPLAGKTLWETLIVHFASENGVIRGKEAVDTLHRLGYFSDRQAANGAVYTNLAKPIFQKVDAGIYRIPTNSQRPSRSMSPSQQAEIEVVANIARKQEGHVRFQQAKDALRESGLISPPSLVV